MSKSTRTTIYIIVILLVVMAGVYFKMPWLWHMVVYHFFWKAMNGILHGRSRIRLGI